MWRATEFLLLFLAAPAWGQTPPPVRPDLAIEAIALDHGCHPIVHLINHGPAPLPRSAYQVRRGVTLLLVTPQGKTPLPLATIDPDQRLRPVGGRLSYTVALPLPKGEHRLTAMIDPTRQIDEADEGNNRRSHRLRCTNAAQPSRQGQVTPPPTLPAPTSPRRDLLTEDLPPPPPPLPPSRTRDPDREPGEFLLLSTDMAAARVLSRRAAPLGLRLKRRRVLRNLGMVVSVFAVPPDTPADEAMERLRRQLPAEQRWRIAPNHRYHLMGRTDPRRWPRRETHWPERTTCATGRTIGLVDTAVNDRHPALRGATVRQRRFVTPGITMAKDDHGTAIATLLVSHSAALPGLVPGARLQVAAVFRQGRRGPETTTEWLLAALDWLAGSPAEVINLSLGGPRNPLLNRALQRLHRRGIHLVAAAGNGGPGSAPPHPAALQEVIAVTAVDARLRPWRRATPGRHIDFAAPGVEVWAARADGRYGYLSGTSFAAPFVTAALLLQPPEILRATARDLGPPGRDLRYGWGLIQPAGCETKDVSRGSRLPPSRHHDTPKE